MHIATVVVLGLVIAEKLSILVATHFPLKKIKVTFSSCQYVLGHMHNFSNVIPGSVEVVLSE